MEDKSKLTAIILVIITVIVVTSSFIINLINKNEKKNDINIVTNYSNFYTVNSCLYRLLTYISTNDTESLILVLDSKYKKQNNINKSNVMNFFQNVGSDSTFVSKKMYYQNINDNITKYYVYGVIEKNEFSEEYSIDNSETKDAYFIVYLDSNNKTFSVEPSSLDIFKSVGDE